MRPARTPRAATPGDKALWSATQMSSATPGTGSTLQRTEGGPVSYRYSRYPAVDRLLDLLDENGLTGNAISCCTNHGQVYLSVILPGHRFTAEYHGCDIQAAAQRWLTGEQDTFAEQCVMHAEATA
jgi:hypothetical protein